MGNFIDNIPIVSITKSIFGIGSGSNPVIIPNQIPINAEPSILLPKPGQGITKGSIVPKNNNSNNNTNNNSNDNIFDSMLNLNQDTLIYIVGGTIIFFILIRD